jgi:hypothetical protein
LPIEELEKKSEPWAVETGLALLTIGGDTVRNISEAIDLLVADAKDGRQHDFTTGSAVGGITVHCSSDDMIEAASRLKRHCELKKYSQKAPKWYGLALSPGDGRLRFTVVLDHPWQHDLNLDQESRKLPNARSWQDFRKFRKRLAATKK